MCRFKCVVLLMSALALVVVPSSALGGTAPDCDTEDYAALAEILAFYPTLFEESDEPGDVFLQLETLVEGFRDDCTVPEIEISTETYYVISSQRANVRSCPAASCEVVTTVSYGDRIEVVSTANDWHEILLDDGELGHIATFLTSENAPAPPQPAATTGTTHPTTGTSIHL
jgi:uncharacterized protein YgiM (DUF1202 family)